MDFETLSHRLVEKNLGGSLKTFHELRSRIDKIGDAQRGDFEQVLKDTVDDIRRARRGFDAPPSWGRDTAFDMCCVAHIASCYDKKHDSCDHTGLTFALCERFIAQPSSPPTRLFELRGFSLPDYLLARPDESKLRCCADLMLAVSGIKGLEYVVSPENYIRYFNVIDGLAQLECLTPNIAEELYMLGVLAAEKEGKFEGIKGSLKNSKHYTTRAIAEEIRLPHGAILSVKHRQQNDVMFSVHSMNGYAPFPQPYGWFGSMNCRLDGSSVLSSGRSSFEAVDSLFKWSSEDEQQALYQAFMRLLAKAESSPDCAVLMSPKRQATYLSQYWAAKHTQRAAERPWLKEVGINPGGLVL